MHESTRARMRAYAEAIGELHIVSRADRYIELQDGPLFLHGRPWHRALASFSIMSEARKLIQKYGIELVSAQDPFEYGFAAMKAVAGTNAKLHIQVHTDFLSPWFVRRGITRSPKVRIPFANRIRLRFADQVLPHADGLRVVSKRIKDSMVARYGTRIKEPVVLPVPARIEVPEAVPLPEHPFTFALIAVSRLAPEKRMQDILVALARIHQQYPSVGLFIVGAGSERPKLEAMTRSLGLTNSVIFLGERSDARGLMQSAQAFIQASAYEGYGLTLIEAALARVPIITTDVGIVGEVFTGYDDVLAAPPGDPAALATAIMGLVEDQQARKLLVLAAEKAARAHLETVHTGPAEIAANLAETLRK